MKLMFSRAAQPLTDIAKAIGPQDVLATLLNNLKVQERQNRVCTTVAIAIVAETWWVSLVVFVVLGSLTRAAFRFAVRPSPYYRR